MAVSIIGAIREYLNKCELLSEVPVKCRHIDWTDAESESYGISIDGDTTLKKFIDGHSKRCYAFTVYFNKVSVEDTNRLESAEFIERLQEWCRAQTLGKNLPELHTGKTATKLEAENGMLLEFDKKQRYGKYAVQFKLIYMA